MTLVGSGTGGGAAPGDALRHAPEDTGRSGGPTSGLLPDAVVDLLVHSRIPQQGLDDSIDVVLVEGAVRAPELVRGQQGVDGLQGLPLPVVGGEALAKIVHRLGDL